MTYMNPRKTATNAMPVPTAQYSTVMKPDRLSKAAKVIDDLGGEATALRHLRKLLEEQAANDFVQGGVLLRIKEMKWFAGYGSFAALCLQEFGFKKSTAYELIRIHKALRDHNVSWDEVKMLGRQKLKLLCGAAAKDLEPNDFSARVEKAKLMTPRQLASEIKGAARAKISKQNKLIIFMHSDDQRAIVEAAFEKEKATIGTSSNGAALLSIFRKYLGYSQPREPDRRIPPPGFERCADGGYVSVSP